jgi:hypothetical protein
MASIYAAGAIHMLFRIQFRVFGWRVPAHEFEDPTSFKYSFPLWKRVLNWTANVTSFLGIVDSSVAGLAVNPTRQRHTVLN